MPAKKSTKNDDKPLNKTAFIKGFAHDTPADEIVAKGKEAGLDIKSKYIWTLQSEMRKAADGAAKKAGKVSKGRKAAKVVPSKAAGVTAGLLAAAVPPAKKKAVSAKKGSHKASKKRTTAPAKVAPASNAEHKMTALVIELGTARADELYRSVRNRLNAILAR